ncbi:MAG TPA: TPM domain-containing protein, partial [Chthoniobacterales bacterium]
MNFLAVVAGVLPAPMQLTRPPLERIRLRSIALFVSVVAGLTASGLQAAEILPPKPAGYFNDYDGIVSKETALRFNEQLAQFERETSNQVVVALWRTMPSQSSIEDFTQRTYQAWSVGQSGRNNGVVFFVFVNDHKMRIQPGYGLEGALPDVICDDIIRNRVAPLFRTGKFEDGLASGINSIFQAIRGEYKGSGKTVKEQHSGGGRSLPLPFFLFAVFLFIIASRLVRRRGYYYSGAGGPFV